MKISAVLALCVSAIASGSAVPALNADILHPRFHGRFLQEQSALEAELAQWEASAFAVEAEGLGFGYASGNGNGNSLHEGATTMTHEEKLQRFFATKMVAEEMNAANPEAIFSTDTPFALMTDDEFAAFVGKGYRYDQLAEVATLEAPAPEVKLRENDDMVKDWTTSGCVAPVKSQGKCGNCWAFGGLASIESIYCIRTGNLVRFSEQELTSCDTRNYGCDGGWGENVVDYVRRRGVCTETDYPYTSGTTKETGKCLLSENKCSKVNTGIRGYYTLPRGRDDYMTHYLQRQPISVSLAAGNPAWRTYTSGVVESCPTRKVDHVVLVVGYGNYNGTDHYKIKNSWGATWGMQGHILLKRNTGSSGTCEVLGSPFFPY